VAERTYGQFCGLVRAVDLVGERWALLLIRDLLVGPKRFTDLHRGLPRIPTNVLTARLKALEEADVVRRRTRTAPDRGVVYELTDFGRGLEDIVLGLGRWGSTLLGTPRPGEIVTVDSMTMALRSTFTPGATHDGPVGFELRIGEVVVHATVDGNSLDAAPGPLPGSADLVIEGGPEIHALMSGDLTPDDALRSGAVLIQGDPDLLDRFVATFRIPRRPVRGTAALA
jgi:DNA-binding HxlR family transcriptional regulator